MERGRWIAICIYMILHGRRLIQATQRIIQPEQIVRDCSANTADWLNCQYRKPQYYTAQYRYQYRPHLRLYPSIRYAGIPVLEALVVIQHYISGLNNANSITQWKEEDESLFQEKPVMKYTRASCLSLSDIVWRSLMLQPASAHMSSTQLVTISVSVSIFYFTK